MIVTEDMLAPHREEGKPLRLTRESVAYLREPPHVPSRLFSDSANFLQSSWRSEQADPHDPRNGLQVVPVLAFVQSVPRLKAKPEWMLLRHQAGGYGCEQICMIATRLELRPALKPALDAIAREGYGAEAGHFSSSDILASRIARYVNALAELGLDCESSWRLLTESVYPIDATQENLDRVANSAPQLSDIVDWDGSIRVRYSSDPAILLLTDNRD